MPQTEPRHPLLKIFRLNSPGEFWYPVAIVLCALTLLYTVLYQHSAARVSDQLDLFNSVLNGTAPRIYQYHVWSHVHILAWFRNALPESPIWFARLYTAYYGFGWIIFLLLIFRLCRRKASVTASAVATLYLTALFPIMWFDSFFVPADPAGGILAVLLMETLLDSRRGPAYYVFLFLSGFIWEKHLLMPFSVALDGIYARRRLSSTLGILIVSLIAGVAGQVVLRLILTTGDTAWSGSTLIGNLRHIPHYLVGIAVLYGAQIYFLISDRKTAPFIFRALALQIPAWFVIYLAVNGVLNEMRGLYMMVPFMWPVLAMFVDKISAQRAQGIT